ncbi:MAG TPA: peptidase S58 DmpA, partial [Alphaproteobacteria bacterium]|nr:peptidase S58 DmpA [Alphaproteobacteria bacterium]
MARLLLFVGVSLHVVTAAHAQDASPPVVELDFPGLEIGVAEYDEGPTGTTVFYFPSGAMAAADVRGGSPGSLNVPVVQLGYEAPFVDAVVFSGGSAYGLAAATGVANAIKERKQAQGDYDHIATVLGAIIYDVGGRRFSRATPDVALGAAALQAAVAGRFPTGARGAGRFAMQGLYFHDGEGTDAFSGWARSGQGAAFARSGSTRIAVFTVVNPMGAVVDRDGRVVRCHRNRSDVQCPRISEWLAETIARRGARTARVDGPTENTTLTLVVTNQKISFAQLQRLATQVHSSMARAIQPFATEEDGDVLYAVTTGEIEDPDVAPVDLAVLASELAWDAVLASVPALPRRSRPSSSAPDAATLRSYAGVYEFPGGGRLTMTLDDDGLRA